jgi:hypothetical protein
MKVALPTAEIIDRGNVKLGTGDIQDMRVNQDVKVKVALPTAKIIDHGNVKLGTGDAQDKRPGK